MHCERRRYEVPALFMVMGGHVRSLEAHAGNTAAFLRRSAPGCHHVAVFSRAKVVQHSFGFNATRIDPQKQSAYDAVDLDALLRRVQASVGGSMSYLITRNARPRAFWAHLDSLFGGFYLLKAVLEHHRTRRGRRDLLLFTRPDVLLSHAIDVARFTAVPPRWAMYVAHSYRDVGVGNDPSEVFLLTSFDHWEAVARFCPLDDLWPEAEEAAAASSTTAASAAASTAASAAVAAAPPPRFCPRRRELQSGCSTELLLGLPQQVIAS